MCVPPLPESITMTFESPVDDDELCAETVARIRQCPICAPKRCDWVWNLRKLSDRSRPAKFERTDGVKLSVTVVNGMHCTRIHHHSWAAGLSA